MIIAALAAITVHIGLMSLEFDPGKVMAPSVSLPRSISIMLEQRIPVQSAARQENNTLKEKSSRQDETRIENKQQLNVKDRIVTETEPEEKTAEPLSAVKVKVHEPAEPVNVKREELFKPETEPSALETARDADGEGLDNEAAQKLEPAGQTNLRNTENGEGAPIQGVLRMAYPRYQLNAPPAYPSLARKRGRQGTVVLKVLVSGEGRVDDLRVDQSSGFSMLDRAAASAVKKWIFEPGRKGNEKVSMWVRVPVTFKLEN